MSLRTELETITTKRELISLAIALGAERLQGWSEAERALVGHPDPLSTRIIRTAQEAIQDGEDPLGDLFCQFYSAEERRPQGATYTPAPIIDAMVRWADLQGHPARVIDPGTGSGRFLAAAGRAFGRTPLLGIEVDPLAAILARAHLVAAGLEARAEILLHDYRSAPIRPIDGQTLYIGNPPYVRHHLIDQHWKEWLVRTARKYGLDASQLAGLHVYFFLATATYARPGDVGVFITASEWLDVNYGRVVRELLLNELGVKTIVVMEPTAEPFPGTATTGVITGFQVHSRPFTIAIGRVNTIQELGELQPEHEVRRERLELEPRWTTLTRAAPQRQEGFIELGEIFRVHRGQVTGANDVWITRADEADLPESVLFPSVTKARELYGAGGVLRDIAHLRRVIDLPVDLDVFEGADRRRIERFLSLAKAQGADSGYIARYRKAWWSVGLRQPAPILASYMARRPPAFVVNRVEARHINIAHGLYPREPMADNLLHAFAEFLSRNIMTSQGRTYAGGLTKFEPREMERLLVPHPQELANGYGREAGA